MPRTHELDGSSRAILSKGAAAGVPLSVLRRHLPILRRCLGTRDEALIVAYCARSQRPRGQRRLGNLLMLTPNRLVVTSESWLRRPRLHLNVHLSQLADVAWTAEPEWGGVYLGATAVDGVREHLWIRLGAVERVWRLDALLREALAVTPRSAGTKLPAADTRPATDAQPADEYPCRAPRRHSNERHDLGGRRPRNERPHGDERTGGSDRKHAGDRRLTDDRTAGVPALTASAAAA